MFDGFADDLLRSAVRVVVGGVPLFEVSSTLLGLKLLSYSIKSTIECGFQQRKCLLFLENP